MRLVPQFLAADGSFKSVLSRLTGTFLSLALVGACVVASPVSEAHALKKKTVEALEKIQSGWGPSFDTLRNDLDIEKDYITWIIEVPVAPMDLRSAEEFRRSMLPIFNLQAQMSKNAETISHMMVAWQCHDADGNIVRGATGMTGEMNGQSKDMIMDGWGQSTFLATFHDGLVHAPDRVDYVVNKSINNGFPIGHITFEVERKSCLKMIKFLTEFLDHPNRPHKKFSLHRRPLKFEGGGCGSFASALLTHAGILPSVQPLMWRKLKANRGLMGLRDATKLPINTTVEFPKDFQATPNYVFVNTLLVTPWTAGDGPTLNILDPELGLYAFRMIAESAAKSTLKKAAATSTTSGFEPRYIYSVDDYAKPPINAEIEINGENDPRAAQVANAARADLKKLKDQGYKVRTTKLGDFFGLIISKD